MLKVTLKHFWLDGYVEISSDLFNSIEELWIIMFECVRHHINKDNTMKQSHKMKWLLVNVTLLKNIKQKNHNSKNINKVYYATNFLFDY